MLPGKKYAPEDYLKVAWRRKSVLVLIPLVALTLTSVFAARLPDRFRSETLILVVPQRVPTEYVKATVTASMQDRLPAISQQILSRTRLERIVKEFDLYPGLRQRGPMEDAILRMRADINVEIVRGESFRIAYESGDADTAMRVTERLAAFFIEENLRDREVLASGTSAFLESQLGDARRRLVEHERRLEEFRRAYNGELPSQLQSNLQTIQNKQFQLQSVRESLSRDRDRKILLERQLSDLLAEPALVVPAATQAQPQAPEAADPAVQLETARNTLKALQVRLKPNHPDVIRLNRLIANLEEKVRLRPDTAANDDARPGAPGESDSAGTRAVATSSPTVRARARELQLEIDNLARQVEFRTGEERSLQEDIAAYQRRVEVAPSRESQLVSLTRDYETLQNIYRSLLAKREDSKIAENLERRQIGEQFKIIDPARRPERPSNPDRLTINLAGLGTGVGLAVGLVVLLEYRRRSVETEQDVLTVLKLPVLAVVPDISTRAEVRRRVLWRMATAAATLALVSGCAVVLSQTLRAIR
ncbi:MAG TPA: GNVR domain-containing protein [Vicinamibacterales bacterium]|nr:GNVR domain-containing protein [Vicinamibacterales bacterium]